MNAHPFLRVRESGANSRKRLLCLKRTRRPFDAATVRELARSTDLECEKCPQRHTSNFVLGRPVRRDCVTREPALNNSRADLAVLRRRT